MSYKWWQKGDVITSIMFVVFVLGMFSGSMLNIIQTNRGLNEGTKIVVRERYSDGTTNIKIVSYKYLEEKTKTPKRQLIDFEIVR